MAWITVRNLGCVLVLFLLTGVGQAQPFQVRLISYNNEGARFARAADLDGDGDMDIVGCATDRRVVWVYENDGLTPPNFTEHQIDTTLRRPNYADFADMNNDGLLDFVACSSLDDKIIWYENNGQSISSFTRHIIDQDPDGANTGDNGACDGPRQIVILDADNDGDIDVFAVGVNNNSVVWYESSGGSEPTFTPSYLSNDFLAARAITAADVDGDGDMDIVAGAWMDDRALWFENDGNNPATFTTRVIASNLGDAVEGQALTWDIEGCDIDGDGDMDLFATRRDGRIDWYENDGNQNFTVNILTREVSIGKSIDVGDVDGDGDFDIASASIVDDLISWFENDGTPEPSFTMHTLTVDPDGSGEEEGLADHARSVTLQDIDGDGDLDFLWQARGAGLLAWHENLRIDDQCKVDINSDGVINFFDILDFLRDFSILGPIGDYNDDLSHDFDDIQAFLNDFSSGC
jgi:VCBS repeat protein